MYLTYGSLPFTIGKTYLQSVKRRRHPQMITDVAQAMDFPDLSEMDLDHWNGDLKLGSGVGQS